MKICKNCGGSYKNEMELCPYCGAQNEELAENRYQGQIKELKQERDFIKKLPLFLKKRATRILFLTALALILCFIPIVAIRSVSIKVQDEKKKTLEQENVEKMEELLTQEDFAGLYEFYNDQPYAYASYDKYREVAEVYYQYMMLMNCIDFYYEYQGKVGDELIQSEAEDAKMWLQKLCEMVEEMQTDNKRLDNEKYIVKIQEMGMESFRESFPEQEELVEE